VFLACPLVNPVSKDNFIYLDGIFYGNHEELLDLLLEHPKVKSTQEPWGMELAWRNKEPMKNYERIERQFLKLLRHPLFTIHHTVWMGSCEYGCVELVKVLIPVCDRLEIRSLWGWAHTGINYACQGNSLPVIQTILQEKPNLSIASHLVFQWCVPESQSIIEYLIHQRNFDINDFCQQYGSAFMSHCSQFQAARFMLPTFMQLADFANWLLTYLEDRDHLKHVFSSKELVKQLNEYAIFQPDIAKERNRFLRWCMRKVPFVCSIIQRVEEDNGPTLLLAQATISTILWTSSVHYRTGLVKPSFTLYSFITHLVLNSTFFSQLRGFL
jgi:hypothetical protein